MIDITAETLLSFSEIPSWTENNLGKRISPNTAHRWRLRGCRGVKLETILIGGTRTTSVEAISRFIKGSTLAQDSQTDLDSFPATPSPHISQAKAYLDSEGL
ncbi:DUF1580 domain-containing protein [Mariniblastus sp.]|nr:DUF1580 domain-containing protein [Mariniblastus sp.]